MLGYACRLPKLVASRVLCMGFCSLCDVLTNEWLVAILQVMLAMTQASMQCNEYFDKMTLGVELIKQEIE